MDIRGKNKNSIRYQKKRIIMKRNRSRIYTIHLNISKDNRRKSNMNNMRNMNNIRNMRTMNNMNKIQSEKYVNRNIKLAILNLKFLIY